MPIKYQRQFPVTTSSFPAVKKRKVDVCLKNKEGEVLFQQDQVTSPEWWSDLAVRIVTTKYFTGKLGSKERETSVFQLINRVVDAITISGFRQGYFDSDSQEVFASDLRYILINQMASFNSPVWFNVGVQEIPQVSACFINSVEDNMESILDLIKTEGMLFSNGSGSGCNMSKLRHDGAPLSKGGTSSGPLSFMRALDASASAIKSGGRTRRSAAMRILNDSHPDVHAFIDCKMLEEKKAHSLISAGYDPGFSVPGGAYDSVSFQNANHSVKVTDDFMKLDTPEKKETMRKIATAAHFCGDPGMQFEGAITRAHLCPNSGPINGSNPCSEYLFLDDSACNLASINLLALDQKNEELFYKELLMITSTMITAMDILVDMASYPTKKIEENSNKFRPLGLGFTNLGALLMVKGLAYDSDEARTLASSIMKAINDEAWKTSVWLGMTMGVSPEMKKNSTVFLDKVPYCTELWNQSLENPNFDVNRMIPRNAQVTVLAPTGTISFMMDCDTTGIEPDFGLVKYKTMVGGTTIKTVNKSLTRSLVNLGYGKEVDLIVSMITDTGKIPENVRPEDRAIFHCAGEISASGHMKMMAACQPYISGAISKTVNLPASSTVQDMEDTYIEAHSLGLKAVAVYREDSKLSQPLSTMIKSRDEEKTQPPVNARQRLPDDRKSITHKFDIAGSEGYIHLGLYPDSNRPGEIFIRMSKTGSTVGGMMDIAATAVSMGLQQGVPIEAFIKKFEFSKFEPSGYTTNPEIPKCSSVMDYISKWLRLKVLSDKTFPVLLKTGRVSSLPSISLEKKQPGPICTECGNSTTRTGTCWTCTECASTSGCA